MRVKGHVFSGVLRGQPLIDIYFHRIVGLLGFEPFRGTMDVELDKPIDIQMFATKEIEHVLMDGAKRTEAHLAPVDLIFSGEGGEERYRCWAMQQLEGPYGKDVVEIIAKDRLSDKFHLAEGREIEIEFFELPNHDRKNFVSSLGRLVSRRKAQLMKGK
jgi:CTP-dependent riboflavin kinase